MLGVFAVAMGWHLTSAQGWIVIHLHETARLIMRVYQSDYARVLSKNTNELKIRHQPRHESEIGVRFAGRDKLVHLIGAGEVALCRGRGYERLGGTGQVGQGFGNGNQLAALTLHSLVSSRDRIAPNCTIRHPVWPIAALQRRMRFFRAVGGVLQDQVSPETR